MLKHLPFRRFFQTPRLFAVAYLALAFHSVILVKFEYWQGPVGVALILLMTFGCLSA